MIGRDIGLPVRRIKHPATAVLLNLKSAKPDDRSWAQSDIGPVLVRISEEVTPDGDRKILNIPITTMRVINRWKGGLFEAEFLQDTSEMEMYRTTKWSEGWEDRRDAFEEKFGIKIQLI